MNRWLAGMALALLGSCASDPTSGTGSQTGNSVVAGRLLRADSSAASGVEVTLQAATWDTTRATTTLRTDAQGAFRFEQVPAGLWLFQSKGTSSSLARILRTNGRDTVLAALRGAATGNVVVEIHLNDTLRTGSLRVLGRTRTWSLATTSREIYVTVAELPPGHAWFSIVGPSNQELRESALLVRAGATDTLRDSCWKRETEGPYADGDGDFDDKGELE